VLSPFCGCLLSSKCLAWMVPERLSAQAFRPLYGLAEGWQQQVVVTPTCVHQLQ
jgi:hypothetical protein